MIRTKRIYEEPSEEDGTRVLVDRLWPRGVSKEEAELEGKEELLARLRQEAGSGTVTLLYAAKDEEKNNAVALKRYIEER